MFPGDTEIKSVVQAIVLISNFQFDYYVPEMQIVLNDLPYTHTQKKEAFTRNGSWPQSYN